MGCESLRDEYDPGNAISLTLDQLKNPIMKFVPIALFLLIQLVTPAIAQESVSSAGQSDTVSGVQIDWNVGETVIQTKALSTGFVTQGLEQPHFVISSIERVNKINLQAKLYPNPTSNWVHLDLKSLPQSKLVLSVFDLSGRMLKTQRIGELSNTIDLNELSAATYIILLETEDQSFREKFSLVISH